MISVYTFVNMRESLDGHATISVTSQIKSQSNFIWHKNVDGTTNKCVKFSVSRF